MHDSNQYILIVKGVTYLMKKFGELVWSCLMWAYFELLRLYTNVWVEPITIGTLVVKGLT